MPLALSPAVEPPKANQPRPSRALAVLLAGLGLALLTFAVLITRELLPRTHHAAATAPQAPPPSGPSPATHAAPAASAAAHALAHAPEPAPAAAPPSPSAAPAPVAAATIAAVVTDPDAFAPSSVFRPPVAKFESFFYDSLPGFNSSELKRSRANHGEWELDAMHGAKPDDLAPRGGVHEATTSHDAQGNEIATWYTIDDGPLAPAIATQLGTTTRVMSRAYVEANRKDFPPELVSLLTK